MSGPPRLPGTNQRVGEVEVVTLAVGARVRWWSSHLRTWRTGTLGAATEHGREVDVDDGGRVTLRYAEPI